MKGQTIWDGDNLDNILPGKTIVIEIPGSKYFHHQEILVQVQSVNRLFDDGNKLSVFVSKFKVIKTQEGMEENRGEVVFDTLFFDTEYKVIKVGGLELDNVLIF